MDHIAPSLTTIATLLLCSGMLQAQNGCPPTVTDVDGNSYPVVQIGGQCWTAKNLTTAHYANGDSIPTGLSDTDWEFTTAGASTVYAFDPANDTLYGKLYSWYAATDPRGLCPQDWHVATDQDWKDMELTLGMDPTEVDLWDLRGELANVGGQLKSTAGWAAPNTGANNSSGFSALPGGYAGYDQTFEFLSIWGNYWTASDNSGSGIGRRITYTDQGVYRSYHINQVGFSCRCVYDQLVGVEEKEGLPELAVFPNPTTGTVQVNLVGEGGNYSLLDPLGHQVVNGRLGSGANTIDLTGLAPGLYVLRIEGRAVQSVRIVKE